MCFCAIISIASIFKIIQNYFECIDRSSEFAKQVGLETTTTTTMVNRGNMLERLRAADFRSRPYIFKSLKTLEPDTEYEVRLWMTLKTRFGQRLFARIGDCLYGFGNQFYSFIADDVEAGLATLNASKYFITKRPLNGNSYSIVFREEERGHDLPASLEELDFNLAHHENLAPLFPELNDIVANL